MANLPSRLSRFFLELRRRRVVRVAVVYAVAAFAVLQAADLLFPALLLPAVAFRILALVAIAGFPVAVALSWAFDLTPTPGPSAVPVDGVVAEPASAEADPPAPPRSVAVLPFVNTSADVENEYFSDGLSEELLNVLAKVPGLRVSSRTSSFAFKHAGVDVREVGLRLGVRTVLEGSVRRAGEQLRITAQLVDATNGYHIWSEVYDRRVQDVFAIQAEISNRIAESLELRLGEPAEHALEVAPTCDVRAYELYLRGRYNLNRLTRTTLRHACDLFRRAIEMEPGFAPAYCGLSDTLAFVYLWFDDDSAHLREAEQAGARAVALAPQLAETHTSTAWVLSLSGRFDEAAAEFEQALERDPGLYEALYLFGRSRFAEGKVEEAADLMERAHVARPDEFQAQSLRAMMLRALGRTGDARVAAAEALRLAERHLELNPGDVRALYLRAQELVELDRIDEARGVADRVLAMEPEDSSVLYNVACLYAKVGETGRAFDALEAALDVGTLHRQWIERDPDLDSLRDHPRFAAIMSRVA
jgi:adenylate cyclase